MTINFENAPYMPSKNALRKRIAYVRKTERPPEPQSLEDLIIPEAFCRTLNNEFFLVKKGGTRKNYSLYNEIKCSSSLLRSVLVNGWYI